MKRLIISLIVALFSSVAFAQSRSYDHDLTPFSSIQVDNDFQVTLVNGNSYHVQLMVDEILKEYVVCEVKGGTLYLSYQERNVPSDIKKLYKSRGSVAPTFSAKVTVPESAGFRQLSFNGRSVLRESEIVFAAATVTITATDNAVIRGLHFTGRNMSVKLSKKAAATLTLNGDQLDVEVNGASLLLSQKTKNTDLKIQGGASVRVSGEASALSVNAKGNSDSIISGTAEKVTWVCAGSAKVDATALVCNEAIITMSSICTLKQAASKKIQLNLSGGATLFYDNNPAITIDQIKNASVSRISK